MKQLSEEKMKISTKPKMIEWMCTHCGMRVPRGATAGRPLPGKCPKRPNNKPHVWVKNRTL